MPEKPFRKSAGIFAFTLLLVLLVVLVSSFALSLLYEKAVVGYMKKYLDEHLLTELSMDDIRFKVLKGFPYATVEITNAVLLSGKDFSTGDFPGSYADTLLQAKSVMLQFDLVKLFHKVYELKKIEVDQGRVNILFDKRNRHNLNLWKTSETPSVNYSVNLRSIVLSDSRIYLSSLSEKLNLLAWCNKTHFRGKVTNSILSGNTRGSLKISSFTVKEKLLAHEASLELDLDMVYSSQHIRISSGKIQLNKAIAGLNGAYKGGKNSTVDLVLTIPTFGLDELMSILPRKNEPLIPSLDFSGNGKLTLMVRGSLGGNKNLLVNAGFELENCTARNRETRTSIHDISMKGTLSGNRPENFALRVEKFQATLGKGQLSGSFNLDNLNTLRFQLDALATFDLAACREFAGLDTIEHMAGFIRSDFSASGSLKQPADSSALVLDLIKKGNFVFENAGIRIKNLPLNIENVTGKASLDKHIQLDSLALRVNGTELLVNGELQNLTAFILKRAILKANVDVTTDILDITKYLSPSENKSSSSGYKSLSLFPADIYLKARVKANHFTAGKFVASDLTLSMSALKDSVFINAFSLKFPDGSISGNAFITGNSASRYNVTCNAQPSNINIQQLFSAFNNFTQTFIVDKNLKGLLSGKVSFFAQWDSTLTLIANSMEARGDFQINNGELLQFDPMLKLSRYIDVEELRHIRFKTLINTIYIHDRLVIIPEMDIHSTAFNIRVSGQHSFDNQFEYRLKVLLSEVLFNKARKKKKEINEFLVEETPEDQTTIPLVIAGTPDAFDVRFDRKKAFHLTRDNMKNDPANDLTLPDKKDFTIEWDEPEDKKPEQKPEDKQNNADDFEVEWEE